MTPVSKHKVMAGIIGYINDGRISEEGVLRATEIVADMSQMTQTVNAKAFCFATASLRGVKNQQHVLDAIRSRTGLDVDVVSWEREAYYDYLAVERLMGMNNVLMTDIGGGSIELVWIRGSSLYQSASLPTGSLKLRRDFVRKVSPESSEMSHIEAAVNGYLDGIGWVGETGCDMLCTVGGTARAVAKLHNEIFLQQNNLKDYGYPVKDLDALFDVLANKDQHNKLIMKLCPDRIYTLAPGFLALRVIVKRAGVKWIKTSRFGVREGYLIEKVWMQGEL